jgi:membrane protein
MLHERPALESEPRRVAPAARLATAEPGEAEPQGGFIRRLWDEIWEDEILDRAAALSYYLVFALFPMLLFLTALLGMMPFTLMDQLMGYLDRVLPSDVVRKTLGEITRGASGGVLSIGIIVALWSASSGMGAVMSALNVAYDATEGRPWWRRRLLAVSLTLGLALLVPTALLLIVFGERAGLALAVRQGLGPTFMMVWGVAQWTVIVLMVSWAVVVVYRLAPAIRLPWRSVVPGAVFAVAAWLLMSIGFKYYVTHVADYNATYGSIGGVILLILWLYLSGVVLLIGAEINSEVAARRRPRALTSG